MSVKGPDPSNRTEVQDKIEDELDNDGAISGAIQDAKDAVLGTLWSALRSLFTGLYIIPLAMVGLIGWVFLGSDRSLQRTVEGFPGLADLPVLVASYVIQGVEPVASMILTSIAGMNLMMVNAVVGESSLLGLGLLFVLQVVELGVLVYGLWAGAQFASAVPYAGPALEAGGAVVTAPFRKFMEVVR